MKPFRHLEPLVEVRRSKIPGAGWGLFTTKKLVRQINEVIKEKGKNKLDVELNQLKEKVGKLVEENRSLRD